MKITDHKLSFKTKMDKFYLVNFSHRLSKKIPLQLKYIHSFEKHSINVQMKGSTRKSLKNQNKVLNITKTKIDTSTD